MSLSVSDATLSYGQHRVLESVSLTVAPNELVVLLGPNGAGKSTLLRVLSGETRPDTGAARLDDRPLATYELDALARRRSFMSQSSLVAFDFTVQEIIEMGWVEGSAQERARQLGRLVASLDLQAFLPRRFNRLSGGEQQRVQFARALLQLSSASAENDAAGRYLLLDEPTASLDLKHELLVLQLARQVLGNGTAVIAVLHDLNLAARFADRLVLMKEGRIVANGPPTEVLVDSTLTKVYGLPLSVERHATLDRLVVHS
ncbi:MAG: heme ABC transporter ATP-binding protein [Pseudomonadota bacterium]